MLYDFIGTGHDADSAAWRIHSHCRICTDREGQFFSQHRDQQRRDRRQSVGQSQTDGLGEEKKETDANSYSHGNLDAQSHRNVNANCDADGVSNGYRDRDSNRDIDCDPYSLRDCNCDPDRICDGN